MNTLPNPQFPYAGSRQLIGGPAPTELMPLENYKLQGKIAGIQQSQQFIPFSMIGINQRFATQSTYHIGNGIQTGQTFNQPLTTKSQF